MFLNTPLINYGGVNMVDITRRVAILNDIKDYSSIFQSYTIGDGQNAEDIAFNFYGNPQYHFIIFLMNDIIDPFFGWVLSSDEFDKFVRDKYGSDKLEDAHHYEIDGDIVPQDTTGSQLVSNYTYEFKENEKRRNIKILKPEYLTAFVDDYNKAIRNNLI